MIKCLIISSGFGLNKVLNKTLIERIKETLKINDIYILIDKCKVIEYKEILGNDFKYIFKEDKGNIMKYLSLNDRLIVINDNVYLGEKINDKYIKSDENFKFDMGYILNVKDINNINDLIQIDDLKIITLNNLLDLYEVRKLLSIKINKNLIKNGVIIENINNVYIDDDCIIKEGTFIESGSHIRGDSIIGKGCFISGEINSSKIGDDVVIDKCEIVDSVVENNVHIGPYSYIHNDCLIKENSYIGSYVEMKKTIIGNSCKIKHQSVLLDCNVGDNCNIGAGVITANYDSKMKHITNIDDNSFIGCNSVIVAPVSIGKNSFIAADTTIVKSVGDGEFSISRVNQINKVRKKVNI